MRNDGDYLFSKGWITVSKPHPWVWVDPKAKSSYYQLADALELQRHRDRHAG